MREITVDAALDNLDAVQEFVAEMIETGPLAALEPKIALAVEEVFVNIASYAYGGSVGSVTVKCGMEPEGMTLVFIDTGIKFDPLDAKEPDITLDAGSRDIGGLGLFLVKKMMSSVSYSYENNQNILTMSIRK